MLAALSCRDILYNVLYFMDADELKTCRLVSKYFQLITERFLTLNIRLRLDDELNWTEDALARIYELSLITHTENFEKERGLFPKLINLHTLNLPDCVAGSGTYTSFSNRAESTTRFLEELPSSLTSLKFGEIQIDEEKPPMLPTNITSLSMSNISIFRVVGQLSLKTLQIYKCDEFTDSHICMLPTSLTQLHLWSNNSLQKLQGLTTLTNLRAVDLSRAYISNESLQYLPSSVRKLEIDSLQYLSEEFTLYLPPYLTSLSIKISTASMYSHNIENYVLPSTLEYLAISSGKMKASECKFPPKLKYLKLSNVSIDGTFSFSNFPTTLQTLHLSNIKFPISALTLLPKSVTCVNLFYSKALKIAQADIEGVASEFRSKKRPFVLSITAGSKVSFTLRI